MARAKYFRYHDGGRAATGYRGKTGDCVVRSIAIATGLPYQHIYDLVNRASTRERTGTRKRGISNARTGVYKSTIHRVMKELGWTWTPTMQIGSGCKVHLRPNELPSGRLVVSVSKHLTTMIDGIITTRTNARAAANVASTATGSRRRAARCIQDKRSSSSHLQRVRNRSNEHKSSAAPTGNDQSITRCRPSQCVALLHANLPSRISL